MTSDVTPVYLGSYKIKVKLNNSLNDHYLLENKAVQDNNINMVKCLVNHGADLHSKAIDGMSTIHAACQNGSLEMVQLLVINYNKTSV